MNIKDKTFFRYAIVGVLNTIVGYGTMFGLTFYNVTPELANTIGHLVGCLNSYILNKRFTFQSKQSHKQDFIRFVLVTFISYVLNLITLMLCYRILDINKYISFIIASIVYVISGYLLHKFWTFKTKD